jgi:hypothetical protein
MRSSFQVLLRYKLAAIRYRITMNLERYVVYSFIYFVVFLVTFLPIAASADSHVEEKVNIIATDHAVIPLHLGDGDELKIIKLRRDNNKAEIIFKYILTYKNKGDDRRSHVADLDGADVVDVIDDSLSDRTFFFPERIAATGCLIALPVFYQIEGLGDSSTYITVFKGTGDVGHRDLQFETYKLVANYEHTPNFTSYVANKISSGSADLDNAYSCNIEEFQEALPRLMKRFVR